MSSQLVALYEKNQDCEMLKKLIEHFDIFKLIHKNCGNKFRNGCGSYLFDGITYEYCASMYKKQKLLYEEAKKASDVLEIGVYMGHSLLIMLLVNPTLKITCIDISDEYSGPAIQTLETYFKNSINFIKGDSTYILPTLTKKFDLFHIDGQHDYSTINSDFSKCIGLRSSGIFTVVFDDYSPRILNDIECFLSKINMQASITDVVVPNCSWTNARIIITVV